MKMLKEERLNAIVSLVDQKGQSKLLKLWDD